MFSHVESTCVVCAAALGRCRARVAHPLCCCTASLLGVFGTFWLLESVQLSLLEDKSEQDADTFLSS